MVAGDNPIHKPEEDVLARLPVAKAFAAHVLSLDASEGLVVGVLGAWGSGKTSFVNLARTDIEEAGATILDFNPWMFSGAEQLVESFFVELAAQLKLRPGLDEIGKSLEEYGETFSGMAWLPLVGPWIERGKTATTLLAKILQRRKEGIGGRREKVQTALSDLDKPIVVVLDDIDRLTTAEIRDLFKLVRLTASFPHIIYILAFDRLRVEDALAEQHIPGRDYLEKILQLAVDLPAVPDHVMNRQIFAALDGALSGIDNPGQLDGEVWPDVFMEIVRPLIRNMRDVRRYAVSVHGTVEALDGQIALADVLALEAIRVLLPDVFGNLHASVAGLTGTADRPYAGAGGDAQAQVDALLAASESRADVVKAMISRLFPAADRYIGGSNYGSDWKRRWLRERRVAHEEILRLYLERVAGEGLEAFTDAERARALLSDGGALDTYLRSLDRERLEDVIQALEAYEDDFTPADSIPTITTLLNLLPELPERQTAGLFDLDPRLIVGRVTYRLLKALPTPAAVEVAVREILPNITTLSAKLELVGQVGYQDGVGHKLVSEEAAAELVEGWRNEVRAASSDDMAREYDLIRVLLRAKPEGEEAYESFNIDDSPALTLRLLQAARTETRSQTAGNRAVRRSSRLAWDILTDISGGEEVLRARIDALKSLNPEGQDELLALADRYLGGWRPSDDD